MIRLTNRGLGYGWAFYYVAGDRAVLRQSFHVLPNVRIPPLLERLR